MTVELVPIAATELAMSRAELLEYSTAQFEHMRAFIEMFFVMLFAYSVAMYAAGTHLTRVQYVLANIMLV